MNTRISTIIKISILTTLGFMLTCCNNGGASGSNTDSDNMSNKSMTLQAVDPTTSVPTNIGQLPNGSEVAISAQGLAAASGYSSSAAIGLVNGTSGKTYTESFSVVASNGTSGKVLPKVSSNCTLSTTKPFCKITLDGTSATVGDYIVTPTFTDNNGNKTTLNPFPASIYSGAPTSGSYSFLLSATSIAVKESFIGITVLNNSQAITQARVDFSASNPNYATLSINSCTLNSESNMCTFSVKGVAIGALNIQSLSLSITSSEFFVNQSTDPGSLDLRVENTSIKQNSRTTTATVTLANSAGISSPAPITVNFSDMNGQLLASPSSCQLTSTSNSCTVTITSTLYAIGADTVIASASDYNNASATLDIITNWQQLTGISGGPTQITHIWGLSQDYSIIAQDSSNQIWTYQNGVWTQTHIPVASYTILYNSTPNSITMVDANNNLWTYNGQKWVQLTGAGSGFDNAPSVYYDKTNGKYNIFGYPTPTNIVMIDNTTQHNLWTFDGTSWTQQTGVAGNPPSVYYNTANYQNNNLNNNGNYNNNISPGAYGYALYGASSINDIVLIDNNHTVWTFDGTNWNQIIYQNKALTVDNTDGIRNTPTHNSILMEQSGTYNIFTYDDGVIVNQGLPYGVGNGTRIQIVNGATTQAFILDTCYTCTGNLYIYTTEKRFVQENGGSTQCSSCHQPEQVSVAKIYGSATPSSIVLVSDDGYNSRHNQDWYDGNTANNWVYVGWPSNINSANNFPSNFPCAVAGHICYIFQSQLWSYDGTASEGAFVQATGGENQPPSALTTYGYATTTDMVLLDTNGVLWTMNNSNWTQQTGQATEPTSISVYPNGATPLEMIGVDTNGQLWQYDAN